VTPSGCDGGRSLFLLLLGLLGLVRAGSADNPCRSALFGTGGALFGAALCPEARGPLLLSASLGPHRIVFRSLYFISATCNFLFESNGAGTASVIHVGAVLRQALTVQGAAPLVFGDYDERRCVEGP
jgi:hypothetical protein